MKKLTLIISVLALVLGMSQCTKRPNMPGLNDYNKHKESITLSTSFGDGAKGEFITAGTGLNYKWKSEDKIYVYATTNVDKKFEGSNPNETHYCGDLTLIGGENTTTGVFNCNEVEMPDGCTAVRFVHYGSDITVTEGAASADFSIQDGSLANISKKVIAIYEGAYRADGIYNCELDVQFAIANLEFDRTTFGAGGYTGETTIHGNLGTVFSVSANGLISTSGSTVSTLNNAIASDTKKVDDYYVVILADGNERTYTYYANHRLLDKATTFNKDILYSDITNPSSPKPYKLTADKVGVLPGLFSVSGTEQVRFSQGNLQYDGTNEKFKFATNQWVILGDNGQGTSGITKQRDLFGWGTSGYDYPTGNTYKNTYFLPYNCVMNGNEHEDISWKYGPKGNYSLTGDCAESDWGVHNAIENGGNATGLWRTITSEQLSYIFNRGKNLVGYGDVCGVRGILILPDSWVKPFGVNAFVPFNGEYNTIYGSTTNFWTTINNSYDADKWKIMENAGAVFIPAGGYRELEIIYNTSYSDPSGYYWTASSKDAYKADILYFCRLNLGFGTEYQFRYRDYGFNVRLVADYSVE